MSFVQIAGHLGADAEERSTATGKRVVSLRVATKVRQGGKDETIWWRVNIWSDRFDKMIPYFRKGSALIIIGEMLKPEIYVDKMGSSQVSLTLSAEIIRFSPFGKPGAEKEERSSSSKDFGHGREEKDHGREREERDHGREEVGVGAGDNSGFTGDDLPF